MLHRLPSTTPGKRPVLNEVQPDLHPLEVLFDVKKLLDTRNVTSTLEIIFSGEG